LPLLVSLKERSTYGELGCFLGTGNKDDLEEDVLADKTTGNKLALFWETMVRPEVEAFSYFQK